MKKEKCESLSNAANLDKLIHSYNYNPETGEVTRNGKVVGSRHKVLGYVEVYVDGRNYYAHRLAHLAMTGHWPDHHVDHINGIKDDNTWSNLRAATVDQNNRNRPSRAASGAKYIRSRETKSMGTRYQVEITRNGATLRSDPVSDLRTAIATRDSWMTGIMDEFDNLDHINDV
ncbi:HNH endonuclease signature motif containing protein [Novosphingobium mangrovi (ex Hu et al. 2023)]|uniref:HNH endonuclease n=1 Tax=Novosphingobium mangrovi (ex Hu et al. 2023) TaxID=2930094 RepID=A0ABT0AG84_9SPHN|nr:HNH endonuclease signature motif containing protein [Novosphingobium mangrovi (ex Hu et al. 2023)]MCJ1962186.1 HNH endonuclease [Novosphingobium mangrovi (ex Hu et al. 2023)]